MENYRQAKKVERIIVSCMLFFVAVVVLAVYSFVALGKTRRKNAEYDNLIAALKQEELSLTQNIDKANSSEYLEEKAREELGMIKDNETLYIFK